MTRIVTLLRLGAFFALFLFACLFTGTEAQAAAPVVKSFTVPASNRTLTMPVIRFTATDDVAVTGYMITESATAPLADDAGWTVTPPPQYTFSAEGSKSLYAWVKDADGTVSTSLSASTVGGSGEVLTITSIDGGGGHTVALKSDGTVAAWGDNIYGQTTIPAGLSGVVAIAAGGLHTIALKSDGTVAAWGDNTYGQTTIPAGLSNVVAIAAGGYHSVALRSDGTVTAWGMNAEGQTTIPAGLSNVVAIAAGGYHTVALRSDGTVTAWGYNSSGQTIIPPVLTDVVAIAAGGFHTVALMPDGTVTAWGDNGQNQAMIPAGLNNVVAIAAGYDHTVALKSNGTVAAWGDNIYGQTTKPAGLSGVVAIDAGGYHSVALKSDGTVTAWGRNAEGQTTIPEELNNVVALAAGENFTVALKSDGTVAAWGDNSSGQTTIPPGLTNVVATAAGWGHTVALKSDGTVTAWGDNDFGQTTIPPGLTNVVAIAAGIGHTVALKSDGTVTAWGWNLSGQTAIPEGLTDVVAIAAGGFHTVALKSDGTVTAWGDVGYGESNLPTAGPDSTAPVIFRFSPAPISSFSEVTIPAFYASDDTGVAGYLITESATPPSAADTGWKATPPVFHAVGTCGTYTLYAWVKDAAGNISSPAVATILVTFNPEELAEAVDNPHDTTGASMTFTTSDTAWFAQNATAINGSDAAQSGVIGNSQKSWLQTTVTGPCSISFYQKVSSLPTYDTLKFSIDGVVKSTISGQVDWQQKTFAITTAGPHILKWTYARNASIQKGQNAAWVDDVVVSPNPKVLLVSPNGGEKLAAGGTSTITWNAPAGGEIQTLIHHRQWSLLEGNHDGLYHEHQL
jgi:alpha-tubulin suppressor-like RCC1 family protein